jgi:basic amino acid/polyamine antiporter, APA family
VIALTAVLVVYAVVALALLHALGPDGIAASRAPLADAVAGAFPGATAVVAVGAALASLGALLALISGISRTALAMARHRDLPAFLDRVGTRHSVPWAAELAVGVVVVVLVLTTDLRGAIGFSSFGVLLYYLVANAAAFTQPAGYRRWPRALPVFGVIGCLVLAATLPFGSVVAGVAVLVVGVVGRAIVLAVRRG